MVIYESNENSLIDCLQHVENFKLFQNGEIKNVDSSNDLFLTLKKNLKELFFNSRLMPAFGVSLHDETLKELKNGDWLQIDFNEELVKNGLSFTSLLFKLEITSGFNLIRLTGRGYHGRCLFLDYDKEVNLKDLLLE